MFNFIYKMILTLFIGIFCTSWFSSAEGKRIFLQSESLLLYFDSLKSSGQVQNLTTECEERYYARTVYYKVLYFRFCSFENSTKFVKPNIEFDNFCRDLGSYFNDNAQTEKYNSIKSTADKHKLLGHGIENDQLWEAHLTCLSVQDFYQEKQLLLTNNSQSKEWIQQPNYTEWFIHPIPFCIPVSCGFTKPAYDEKPSPPAVVDCLPPSYKTALYAIFLIDALIAFLIFLSNFLILVVTPKTKIVETPHGYFRMFLALADMLTAIVVCGAINSNYTLHFTAHPFNERGEAVSELDYHNRSFVDGFGITAVLSFSASIFTLVVISMDRFAAIYRPILYTVHVRKMKSYAGLTIFVVWFLSLLIAIIPVWLPDYYRYSFATAGLIISPNFYVVYVVFLGFSLLAVWALNVTLYALVKNRPDFERCQDKKLKSSATPSSDGTNYACKKPKTSLVTITDIFTKRLSSAASTLDNVITVQQQLHLSQQQKISARKRLELSLAKTVRYIVIAFSLALVPLLIAMGTGRSTTLNPSGPNFSPIGKAAWNSVSYFASRILFSNSFVNCIIYSYRSDDFRAALKKIFHS